MKTDNKNNKPFENSSKRYELFLNNQILNTDVSSIRDAQSLYKNVQPKCLGLKKGERIIS